MIVKAGLMIDFGNSETRVIVTAGTRSYRFNLSNRFAQLEAGYMVSKKYVNNRSTIFSYKTNHYANGEIVDREFTRSALAPASKRSKTGQIATELTLRLAFAKAVELVASAYNIGISELDITFNVSALLPPLDHEKNEAALEEMIRGVTEVSVLAPHQFKRDLKVDNIMIQSEGVAAFLGALFKEVGAVKADDAVGVSLESGNVSVTEYTSNAALVEVDNNRKFMEGYILVLDIGAGTTDLALFLDMELVERSKDSFNTGGNLVQSIVSREIRKNFGYMPPSVKDVVLTGVLKEGSTDHDVSAVVTQAKSEYAKEAVSYIRDYIYNMQVDLPVVKGLLVVGGGAVPTIKDGAEVSPSMGAVLVDYLKELAPSMELLDTEDKNLRDLNIEGLMYMHKYA